MAAKPKAKLTVRNMPWEPLLNTCWATAPQPNICRERLVNCSTNTSLNNIAVADSAGPCSCFQLQAQPGSLLKPARWEDRASLIEPRMLWDWAGAKPARRPHPLGHASPALTNLEFLLFSYVIGAVVYTIDCTSSVILVKFVQKYPFEDAPIARLIWGQMLLHPELHQYNHNRYRHCNAASASGQPSLKGFADYLMHQQVEPSQQAAACSEGWQPQRRSGGVSGADQTNEIKKGR
ncbi:hypothetical protein EYF80_022786 [Liparis tanakae]|uniref:Uncharacterized protein n=1 Tax=Liparis tanakae TaxID=230148 RepID=A0A4Z2HPU9_9TELE|nr:hypothetical protein EYF80_022786 [Liparis tanakae]